jgi:hypothetical protein
VRGVEGSQRRRHPLFIDPGLGSSPVYQWGLAWMLEGSEGSPLGTFALSFASSMKNTVGVVEDK